MDIVIEVSLKPEILTLLKSSKDDKSVDEIIKVSLVVLLFTDGLVSLARAAELADMGIGDFVNFLKTHNILWSEYTDESKKLDDTTLKYIIEGKSNNG